MRMGKQEGVLNNLQMAVSLGTRYKKLALNNQISILVRQGNVEGAKEIAKTVTKEYPNYFYGHYNLAWAYLLQKHLKKAEIQYKAALKIIPNHVRANCEIAELYIKTGQQRKANKHINRVNELDQHCPDFIETMKN